MSGASWAVFCESSNRSAEEEDCCLGFMVNMSEIFLCLKTSLFSITFLWSQSGCWILEMGQVW